MSDDWQREYEEDRRRMAAGGDLDIRARRGAAHDDEDLMKAYYGGAAAPEPAARPPPAAAPSFDAPPPPPPPSAAAGSSPAFGRRLDDSIVAGEPPIAVLPEMFKATLGTKVGSQLYFAEAAQIYFKGFIGSSKADMCLLVTRGGMYFGDVVTGALVVFVAFVDMTSVYILGDRLFAIRCERPGLPKQEVVSNVLGRRSDLLSIVRRLYSAATNGDLNVIEGGLDREKSFKKEAVYLARSAWRWLPREDPRSGLPLVGVPQEHRIAYAPLIPKILHHFGGVNHHTVDKKGKAVVERRGCWITQACLFLSLPAGPKDNGRDIRRCVGIEHIRAVVTGAPAELGLSIMAGPPQPDLMLSFDAPAVRDTVVHILSRCYECRTGHPLSVRPVGSCAGSLQLVNEEKFVPQLFAMKTVAELYDFLSGPIKP